MVKHLGVVPTLNGSLTEIWNIIYESEILKISMFSVGKRV